MRKVVIHGPGSYGRLKIEEHPDPVPRAGESLVRVRAAGVNFADVAVRLGVYSSARKYVGWPITPGFEFAGEVVATGDGPGGFKAGDRVFGITRFGAYASHVCAPSHQLFPVPRGFSIVQAAGFPAVFLTAYHAIFQSLPWRKGWTVLVHSAAGGVGTALLQLGRIAQWKLVGVVGSSHKVEVAKRFGADFVIDRGGEDLWRRAEEISPRGYDAIFDASGPATLRASFDHLAPTGKLVTYGFHSALSTKGGISHYFSIARNILRLPRFSPLEMVNVNRSVIAFNLSFLFERADLLAEAMRDLLKWAEEGRIAPPQVTLFDFERVADAHRAIESGTTTGKLVLRF